MSDDDLIIRVTAPGVEQASRSVENLSDKLEELTEIMKNTGSGSKEFKTLKTEFDNISKAAREYARLVGDINKTNSDAAISQQKLSSEMNKAAVQAQKLYTEQSKNALIQQKVATEMNKTAISASRLQMQQERAAAASAKMQAAAERAAAPYNKMRTELKDYENKLYDAITAGKLNDTALAAMGTKYNRLKTELDTVNSKFKQVTNTMDEGRMAGMAFASFLGNLAANFIQNVISSLGNMVSEISKAGVALDGITNTFAAGARGWKQGGEEMEFVAKTADRLGLNLQSTYEPYAKFMTSFTRSDGTLQESRQIFEDLSEAMVALHLNSAQMQNIFVALEQMANKGTVQAEELKRQLGNALPGAFELAAQSMGVTTAELMDMMKAGEVVSRDFLPKFAALVKDSLGKQVGIAVNQYNSHLNRLQSQTFLLQANLGQLWNNAIMPVIYGETQLLRVVNSGTGAIKNSAAATTLLQTALIATGAAAVLFVKQFGIVNTSLALMKTNAIAASKVLWALIANPVGATLLAIGGAAIYCANSISKANQKYEEMAVQQRDVTNNMVGLISEYSQLAEITNKSEAQQEAYNRVLNSMKEKYPTILDYMSTHQINLKNLTQEQADNIASMAIQQEMQNAEKSKLEELNDTWLKNMATIRKHIQLTLLGAQAVEVFVAHVAVTIGQVFTRTGAVVAEFFSKISGLLGKSYNGMAAGLEKVGLDNMAAKYRAAADYVNNIAIKTDDWATNTWQLGMAFRQNLNAGLKECAKAVDQIDIDRQEKVTSKYKNTVADLGKEQGKLAQQLMYSSTALSNVATGKEGKKGKSTKTKTGKSAIEQAKSEWQMLSSAVSDAEDKLKSAWAANADEKTIEKLKNNFNMLKSKQDEVNKKMQELTATTLTGYKKIQNEAKKATETYQNMIQEYVAGNSTITRASLKQAASDMKRKNAIVDYNDELVESESLMSITRREAGKLADSLVDTLFDPLKEGETVWSRFKDAGITALKELATNGIKTYGNLMLKGFQSAWAGANPAASFGSKLGTGLSGAISGLFKMPIAQQATQTATTGTGTGLFSELSTAWGNLMGKFDIGKSSTSGGQMTGAAANILTDLNSQASVLTQTLMSATTPATDAMASSISAIANPAMQAASGVATMSMSAPIAAVGMMGMTASMTALAPAATSAAPALMQMGAALGTIAANASMAATSMAALAVATAAESVARIPLVGGFLAPVAAAATGAAIAAGAVMTGAGIAAGTTMAGAGQMFGGAMSGIGNKLGGFSGITKSPSIIPHAKGGVVSSPTTFPMKGGNIGLAGEAGMEVIAPAKRMSNGDVGIGAVQPKVTINNYTNAAVEVKQRPDNSTEIKIAELNAMLSSSRTNSGMAAAQNRMQKKGRQIG